MKKKNIKLGKLNLNKSNIASFDQTQKILGASGVGPGCNSDIECTVSCPQDTCTSVPGPQPTDNCNTQFPVCQATDGFTCGGACDSYGAFGCLNTINETVGFGS